MVRRRQTPSSVNIVMIILNININSVLLLSALSVCPVSSQSSDREHLTPHTSHLTPQTLLLTAEQMLKWSVHNIPHSVAREGLDTAQSDWYVQGVPEKSLPREIF